MQAQPGSTARPGTVEEALALVHAGLDHLTSADWRALGAAVQARALRELGAAASRLAVAQAEALRAFDDCGGYAGDGHPSAQSWLQHQAQLTGRASRDLRAWERRLSTHPVLRDAIAAGELTQSWAGQLAQWTERLPAEEVDKADKILLDAVRVGLPLRPDVARIAQAIYEAVKGQQPDEDPDDDGFADRGLRLGTTLGGAGRVHGDLTARCAELLARVVDAFGKPLSGGDDPRTQAQRNHDALETALGLSLGVPDVPQSGGMKTQALVVIPLADLIAMDGGSILAQQWLAAQDEKIRAATITAHATPGPAGGDGWLTGPAADATACAAHITPVVTGTPDWDVISAMADVFLAAHGLGEHGGTPHDGAGGDRPASDSGASHGSGGRDGRGAGHDSGASVGSDGSGGDDLAGLGDDPAGPGGQPGPAHACGCTCGGCDCPPPGLRGPVSPEARLALERTLLRMAIRALSGPDGLAGFLRASLLGRPFSGTSLPLDLGSTDHIPDHLRRAVILRDRHCQWPGGCDRPASQCEPHHLHPRHAGGDTALGNLALFCLAHHHHFIHRLGWHVTRHPEGTLTATSPAGKTLHSHGPRPQGRPATSQPSDTGPPGG